MGTDRATWIEAFAQTHRSFFRVAEGEITIYTGGVSIDAYLHYDINAYAALILAALLLVMHWRRSTASYATRLFRRVIYGTIAMLLLEVLSWAFDRQPGEANRYLNYMFNWIYIWLNPLVVTLWSAHIDYRIYGSRDRLRRRIYYAYLMLFSTALMVANFFRPVVFFIDEANVYSRGPGLWLLVAAVYLQFLYLVVLAYRERGHKKDGVVFAIFAMMAAPALGAAVQMLVFGAFIIWPLMAVVLVLSYIVLETVASSRDYLTGLASRLRVDEYVRRLVENGVEFGLAVIDLDDFKYVNDRYGHQAGDEQLRRFSAILARVFADARIVGRLGGDEFVAVTREADQVEMYRYKENLRLALMQESINGIHKDMLRFSYGAVVYHGDPEVTWDALYARADAAMYADKAENKNQQRRSTDRQDIRRDQSR